MPVVWSNLEAPVRVGEAIELCPPKFGKVMTAQRYRFSDDREDDFVLYGRPDKIKPPSIVFPLTPGYNVVVERQFRYGAGEFVIELPGGNPKPGEDPIAVLKKELLEETGYEVKGEIVNLCAAGVWFDPASVPTPFIPLLATGCVYVQEPSRELNEIIEVKEIPLADFLGMIRRGEVRDSKTISTSILACMRINLI